MKGRGRLHFNVGPLELDLVNDILPDSPIYLDQGGQTDGGHVFGIQSRDSPPFCPTHRTAMGHGHKIVQL